MGLPSVSGKAELSLFGTAAPGFPISLLPSLLQEGSGMMGEAVHWLRAAKRSLGLWIPVEFSGSCFDGLGSFRDCVPTMALFGPFGPQFSSTPFPQALSSGQVPQLSITQQACSRLGYFWSPSCCGEGLGEPSAASGSFDYCPLQCPSLSLSP